MPANTFSFTAVVESPSLSGTYPNNCYAAIELVASNTHNPSDAASIIHYREVTGFMTVDPTFAPSKAVSIVSPTLMANDSLVPPDSHYKVTLLCNGKLDPATGKPTGGQIVETFRVQKNLAGVSPLPTMPEYLTNIGVPI